MAVIFEPLFIKNKPTTYQSAFEPVAQLKLRLRPFVKSIKG